MVHVQSEVTVLGKIEHEHAVGRESFVGVILGGVSLAREYSLDPYLVRSPMPRLSGFASTPSTLDVYVNGRVYTRDSLQDALKAGQPDELLVIIDDYYKAFQVSFAVSGATGGALLPSGSAFFPSGANVAIAAVNGTAANCLGLKALTESYHAVICAEGAHIYTDECGAPEKFTGSKLVPLASTNVK